MNSKKDSSILSFAQGRQESCLLTDASASNSMQESSGIIKSGLVSVLLPNVKTKNFYGVLSGLSLELHVSEKSQRKKKCSKHNIALESCFNLAQQTFPKHKLCMSVMTPDETFLIRGDNDKDTIEWYKVTLSAMIPARALGLGRPVFDNEFFEFAWDVFVSSSPKLKKPVANPDNSPNICVKKPELSNAQYRLCFYPHTIILCARNIGPVSTSCLPKSGLPPFKSTDFVEFSRQYLSNYGHQEKFFFMRIGRCAPTGLCEVWIQCESEEISQDVHNKLTDIIDRETEKKRKGLIALGPLPNAIPFNKTSLRSKHRAKSPQSLANGIIEEQKSSDSFCLSHCSPGTKAWCRRQLGQTSPQKHSLSSTLSQSSREKRLVLRDYKAKVDSLEEELYYERQMARNQMHRENCSVDQAVAADIDRWNCSIRTRGLGSHSASNICGTANTAMAKETDMQRKYYNSNSITPPLVELCNHHRDSVVSGEEETEDSGGTLRFNNYDSNSRSASNNNLPLATNQQQQRFLVEALVECHDNGQEEAQVKTEETADNSSYINRRSSQDTLSNQFFTNSPNTEDSSSAADVGADDSSLSLSDLQTPTSCNDDARKRLTNSMIRRRAKEICATDSENASTSSSLISAGGQLTDCERQGRPNNDHVCDGEYIFMDKASCSSDNSGSATHLIVPHKFENHIMTNPEEICSYASDSGDSCYSSMVNGQLNSRAFSFSSEMPRPTRLQGNFPSETGNCAQSKNFNSIRDKNCYLPINGNSALSEDKLFNSRHSVMGTPLMENGEMKDDFLDNKQSKNFARAQNLLVLPDEESRRRTFSLGSTSWLTKPFRKLSFNNANRLRNSPSKSGSSLTNSVTADSEDKQSYGCLSSRQPSTCSFASSRHTRSDSIDSSHSTSFVHNNASVTPTLLSQRLFSGSNMRRKISERLPDTDHFIELDFAPNSTTILSNSSSTTSVGNYSCQGARKGNSNARRQLAHPTTQLTMYKRKGMSRGSATRPRRISKQYQGLPDYGLEEVQCFIAPADTKKEVSLSDSTSLHSTFSQKTDPGHFETIKEHASGSSKTSSKNSLNKRAKTPVESAGEGDGEYVMIQANKQEPNNAKLIIQQ
uniref:Insulin receptor substrate 1 n=1 Tax=Ditylenchus dipsaci TaxID=166011 RepID=A0A915CUB2_9BILA